MENMGKAIDARFRDTTKAVEKLRARGGKIVFVRFPNSGELKALEDRLNPRTRDWERLLKDTNAPGIYFEDFPELATFTCPEWSHLSAGDSVEFSKAPHPPSSARRFRCSSFAIRHSAFAIHTPPSGVSSACKTACARC